MSHPEVLVHRLAPSDVASLEALAIVFGEAFDDADTYTGRRPSVAYLRTLLAGDTFITLYAKLGTREEVLHFDIAVSEEEDASDRPAAS